MRNLLPFGFALKVRLVAALVLATSLVVLGLLLLPHGNGSPFAGSQDPGPTLTPAGSPQPTPVSSATAAAPSAAGSPRPVALNPLPSPIGPTPGTALPHPSPVAFPTATASAALLATLAPTLLPTSSPTPTATPTPPPTPTPTVPPFTADFVLDGGPAFASRGQEFVFQVVVEAGPNSPLDAAQVYLDYDPGALRAVSIGEGFVLEVGLQSNIDHRRGRVDYAAGTLRGVVSHPFILAAVTFAVLTEARAGTTTVGFAPRRAPRQTKAVSRGFDITGNLIPVTLTIE